MMYFLFDFFAFLFHLLQFYVEDECGVGGDERSCTALAVAQSPRDKETVFCSFLHQLQTLCPSCNHLLQGECGGFTALHATVEYGSVDKETLIVAHHSVLGRRLLAIAFLQHLILQATGQGDDTSLLGILG